MVFLLSGYQNFSLFPKIGIFGPFAPQSDQKNNANKMPRSVSVMWVSKLLLPLLKIRIFGPKTAIFAPKYALLGTYRPCLIIWCPVGSLVGGCGARAVPRKTPIYLIMVSLEPKRGSEFVRGTGYGRPGDDIVGD